ncbi:ABC transporter permease [Diaphorobacter limosus]|uniref:Transport permease protein n=1 Tax=Diaphorobacter limosus TaxID=3036128 RepID=A0ABZ0J817_9BURK|nr:ABC transporter permease [Diaphorobacter sp. Y-1]WOO34425.1 ABC transporter permease [Diaphorobacter sp. Y-1]
MHIFSISPREVMVSLWRNRNLIAVSVRREVLGRYRGSVFGIFWSFFNPLLMLAIYTVVFSVVFQARWGAGSSSKTEFAMVLFAGLIIFNLFTECINRSPGLIISNVNLVKKVVFPLEILPAVGVLTAMFHALISFGVWFLAYGLFFGIPHVTVLLLPIVVWPLLMFIMGLSWCLASLGVYLRDVSQIISVVTSVLMFMSPIFYPVSALPESYRQFLYLNPLTPVIEMTRDVLYWGRVPSFELLVIYWVATAFVAWVGFVWFQKTRKGFADVL